MHKAADYMPYYHACLIEAGKLAQGLQKAGITTGTTVFKFLKKHGFYALPGEAVGDLRMYDWLYKQGNPADQHEGIAFVMCFSDDTPPIILSDNKHGSACFNLQSQAIVLFDVEVWSTLELAISLMHEGYHAEQQLSSKLDGTPPSNKKSNEETNAWLLSLNLLHVGGGRLWSEVIKKEVDKMYKENLVTARKNSQELIFKTSATNWSEFDTIFGATKSEAVKESRRFLASLDASMVYWSTFGMKQPEICQQIIRQTY